LAVRQVKMDGSSRAPRLEHGLIEVGEQGVEKELLLWGRDIERPLGKGGKEIALRQRLIGPGIVEFEWSVRGQDQQRCASEGGFHHGGQIVGGCRSRGTDQARQHATLRRTLGPEGGAAFVIEQFRDDSWLLFQRQNERYGARTWG